MIEFLKKALVFVILVFLAYYASRFVVGYSLAKQVRACAVKLDSGGKLSKATTDAEKRRIQIGVIDCVEENLSFPGSLMFDKKKIVDSF